jgi:hypothetical protein
LHEQWHAAERAHYLSMSEHIPESDWRQFKELHPILCERFCRNVLDDLQDVIGSSDQSAHERYIKVYRLLERRDKELARAFNDFRRSTALMQLAIMRSMRLLGDDDLLRFTPETQKFVKELSSIAK